MKTPREVLLNRHRAAEPQLNSTCRTVVEELAKKKTKQQNLLLVSLLWYPRIFWRELIWPARRIWAGFAATWLVVVAANLADWHSSPVTQAKTKLPPSQVLTAWRQQQKFLTELVGQTDWGDAEKPKATTPRPRTERQATFSIV